MRGPEEPTQSPESPTVRALRLESWAALRVSGVDAQTFLQGQLSADLRALTPDRALWASYNSPKGRMLAVVQLLRDADEVIELWMPRALIDPVAKRLRMFVMRSKLSIALPEPRTVEAATDARDRAVLIKAGVPVVYPQTQDRWVAQMANLDLIGGISFDKGCYTGQEIVARLHYLGALKKRMFLVRGIGAAPAPGSAIRLSAGDRQAVGEIVDAVGDETAAGFIASAVLQIAQAESIGLVTEAGAGLLAQPYHYAPPTASGSSALPW